MQTSAKSASGFEMVISQEKLMNAKHIIFITGAFIHHSCWDNWRIFFESNGYICDAPPWIYKDTADAKTLRDRKPEDFDLAVLTLKELIDYYAGIVKKYPEKPIIIGHSLGGLITQILLNKDLGAAGVAIHSFPPQGIFPYEFHFLKSVWRSFGFLTSRKKTYLMSFQKWQYIFTNEMSLAEQKYFYEKFVIPESKTVLRGVMKNAAAVDFAKPHAPLLLTSGGIDRIIPASLGLRNFKKYKESGSILEYKNFERHNHFVLGQTDWKQIAGYILEWLNTY